MFGLMGFSGSLPLYVIHRYCICLLIGQIKILACLLVAPRPKLTVHSNILPARSASGLGMYAKSSHFG